MFEQIWKVACDFVGLLANLCTVILGAIAICSLIWRRKQISQILRYLINNRHQEKASRLSETLTQLSALSYKDKQARTKISELLARVNGLLVSYNFEPFIEFKSRAIEMLDENYNLSEAIIKTFVFELQETLAEHSYQLSLGNHHED